MRKGESIDSNFRGILGRGRGLGTGTVHNDPSLGRVKTYLMEAPGDGSNKSRINSATPHQGPSDLLTIYCLAGGGGGGGALEGNRIKLRKAAP